MNAQQSQIIVPSDMANGFIETGNTDEAAILRAMGCEPIDGAACRVDHDSKNPYGSGRGKVLFSLRGYSETWKHRSPAGKLSGYPTSELRRAYNSVGDPSLTLDEMIEKIADPELRQQIQNQLPLAIAEHGRAFAQARQHCMGMVHTAPRHATGRNRKGRRFSINVNRPDLARKFEA